MRRGIASAAGSLAVAVLLALPGAAGAAKIQVTISTDEFGGAAPDACSLRDAVQTANIDADFGECTRTGTGTKDTIMLEGGTTYARSIDTDFEDANAGGDLDITGKTIIKVKGDGSATIDANDMDRGLDLRDGAKVTASSLVVLDGEQAFSTSTAHTGGGGIRVNQGADLELTDSELRSNETLGNGGSPNGGGLLDQGGDATLRQVLIADNSSSNVGGGIALTVGTLKVLRSTLSLNVSADSGAGIYASGPTDDSSLSLVRSTLTQNQALDEDFGDGGGVAIGFGGTHRIVNSTLSGNIAADDGGGINGSAAPLKVNATTITGNTAGYEETGGGAGGGVAGSGGVYKNSIIDDNLNPLAIGNEEDCSGNFSLGGTHNLIGKDTGCFAQGQLVAADPKLGPLADNGGPTFTRKLLKGSKAIGHAGNSAPPKDQRGHPRDADPDIGAFER